MIIYNHAYDIFNCAFRIIALLYKSKMQFSSDQIRIFDFIIAFPEMINTATLPKNAQRGKKIIANKYVSPQSHQKVFYEIEHFQTCALNHLASLSIIDVDKYKEGIIIMNDSIILPQNILELINSIDENSIRAMNICINSLHSIPVEGQNGLKHRTKIMEYRYDV